MYIAIPVHLYSGTRWFSATTMDISQDGVRIRLAEEITLSKRLGLRIANKSETFGMKVCWSTGYEAGCSFLETLDENTYTKLVLDSISV
jgi:hypothetical protein